MDNQGYVRRETVTIQMYQYTFRRSDYRLKGN